MSNKIKLSQHLFLRVLDLVAEERVRQDLLVVTGALPFNCSNDVPDLVKLAVLGEEFGEVSREVYHLSTDRPLADYPIIREKLRTELIQVAAVAVAWAEALTDKADKEKTGTQGVLPC